MLHLRAATMFKVPDEAFMARVVDQPLAGVVRYPDDVEGV